MQRQNQVGLVAGTVVTAALAAVLFAGPWRLLAYRPGGLVPVAQVNEDPTAVFVCVGVVGVVSTAAGFVYPYYAGGAGVQWADLARTILYVPAGVLLTGAMGTMVLATVRELSGGVARALVAGLVTLFVGVALGGVLSLVVAALFVPPAVVGVYAGVRLARLTGAEDSVVFEDAGDRDMPWRSDAAGDPAGGAGERPATGRRGRAAALTPSLDRDSPERFGWWAGVAGTALVATMLVVGPWAPYAVTPTGTLPVTERPGGGSPFVPAVALLAVGAGYAAAARYVGAVDAPADGWRRAMAAQAALAPMVVGMAVAVVVQVVHTMATLPSAAAPAGLLLGVVGAAVGGILSGTVSGFAAGVVVGVPTAAGVYLSRVSP